MYELFNLLYFNVNISVLGESNQRYSALVRIAHISLLVVLIKHCTLLLYSLTFAVLLFNITTVKVYFITSLVLLSCCSNGQTRLVKYHIFQFNINQLI